MPTAANSNIAVGARPSGTNRPMPAPASSRRHTDPGINVATALRAARTSQAPSPSARMPNMRIHTSWGKLRPSGASSKAGANSRPAPVMHGYRPETCSERVAAFEPAMRADVVGPGGWGGPLQSHARRVPVDLALSITAAVFFSSRSRHRPHEADVNQPRHGGWRTEARHMAEAVEQLQLGVGQACGKAPGVGWRRGRIGRALHYQRRQAQRSQPDLHLQRAAASVAEVVVRRCRPSRPAPTASMGPGRSARRTGGHRGGAQTCGTPTLQSPYCMPVLRLQERDGCPETAAGQ